MLAHVTQHPAKHQVIAAAKRVREAYTGIEKRFWCVRRTRSRFLHVGITCFGAVKETAGARMGDFNTIVRAPAL